MLGRYVMQLPFRHCFKAVGSMRAHSKFVDLRRSIGRSSLAQRGGFVRTEAESSQGEGEQGLGRVRKTGLQRGRPRTPRTQDPTAFGTDRPASGEDFRNARRSQELSRFKSQQDNRFNGAANSMSQQDNRLAKDFSSAKDQSYSSEAAEDVGNWGYPQAYPGRADDFPSRGINGGYRESPFPTRRRDSAGARPSFPEDRYRARQRVQSRASSPHHRSVAPWESSDAQRPSAFEPNRRGRKPGREDSPAGARQQDGADSAARGSFGALPMSERAAPSAPASREIPSPQPTEGETRSFQETLNPHFQSFYGRNERAAETPQNKIEGRNARKHREESQDAWNGRDWNNKPWESNGQRGKPVVGRDGSSNRWEMKSPDVKGYPKQAGRFPAVITGLQQPSTYSRSSPAEVSRLKEIKDNWRGDAVYGVSPVLSALSAKRRQIHKLYLQKGTRPGSKSLVEAQKLAEELGVPVELVSKHDLNEVTNHALHQGVVVDCSAVMALPMETFPPASAHTPELLSRPPLWLALDEVNDPQNFGAILRSAHFLGASGVITCTRNSCPLSPAVSKSSAGALEHMIVRSADKLQQTLAQAKADGWKVVGAVAKEGALDCHSVELNEPTILVVGSEGKGLRVNVSAACTSFIQVGGISPQPGGPDHSAVDSLNVSVAAAILMHQMLGKAKWTEPATTGTPDLPVA